MLMFEYPYIIITILAVCFVILIAVGIYFALRGIKTANSATEKDFVNLGRVEALFEKSAKSQSNRCVFYISLDYDNYRNLHSHQQTMNIMTELRQILPGYFSDGDNSAVAVYGEKNSVAFAKWSEEKSKTMAEDCIFSLNKCLREHAAINLVDIRVGVYFAHGTHVSFDEAVDRAKKACMLAINNGTSYAEWNVAGGKALEKKIKIENNIEKEIDDNRFFLEYQPVLDAKTGKIIGAEVLSRLNSESDGVLNPGSFLSAVDSVGLNEKFDYYVFEKNCKWISNDKKLREPYKFTINFSRATSSEPQFVEKIISIAEKYNLNFSCLAVEILEDKNIVGEARKQMIQNLSTLKEKGISVLLDDFGSGHTTFGDLQSLNISIVKIDKSITQNSVTDTGFIILKNIIRTSQDIGFKTLCEGIETKEQEEAAIKAGCDLLQGFYYYRPMPVAQLEKVLKENSGGN